MKGGLGRFLSWFNLVICSISEFYSECVRNHACQEGRNFAPVVSVSGVAYWWALRRDGGKRLRSYVLRR